METSSPSLISRTMLILPRIFLWGSFAMGTALLLAFIITHQPYLLEWGYLYTCSAFIVNLIAAVVLVGYAAVDNEYGEAIRGRTVSMFWNIPVTIIYIIIIIAFL